MANKNEKKPVPSSQPAENSSGNFELEEFFRSLKAGSEPPKADSKAVAAAMDAAQRFATEQDAEDASEEMAQEFSGEAGTIACQVCGYRNREGNKFCGMCGTVILAADKGSSVNSQAEEAPLPAAIATSAGSLAEPILRQPTTRPSGNETHHYHHHYHHHYFPGAQDGTSARMAEPVRDPAREDKMRSASMALRGDLSRAEAAVRAITQEWVLACNTKHLDDLLELYTSDALVLRSNYPPIRGAAAVREFFFGALDAGLGEVEIDPLRVDLAGDMAYEAGRCKALIPSSTGKRREERGKYLWVLQRQSAGEWKLVADCWSSDLTLSMLESDIPANAVIKTNVPKK